MSALDGFQSVEIAEACYYSASSGDAVDILDEDEEDAWGSS